MDGGAVSGRGSEVGVGSGMCSVGHSRMKSKGMMVSRRCYSHRGMEVECRAGTRLQFEGER